MRGDSDLFTVVTLTHDRVEETARVGMPGILKQVACRRGLHDLAREHDGGAFGIVAMTPRSWVMSQTEAPL